MNDPLNGQQPKELDVPKLKKLAKEIGEDMNKVPSDDQVLRLWHEYLDESQDPSLDGFAKWILEQCRGEHSARIDEPRQSKSFGGVSNLTWFALFFSIFALIVSIFKEG